MLKCIAIDDEPLALRQMKNYIERHPMLEGIGYFRDANKAYSLVESGEVELIFSDIEMPTIGGLDFIESLQDTYRPMVIFTTAYSEYAIEGFRLEALDYLLKPFSYSDFGRSVSRAISLQELRNSNDIDREVVESSEMCHISVRSNHKVELIAVEDISYIESESEYIRIVLHSGRNVVTLYRLKNIESELPSTQFIRIHRCYIINLNQVKSYDRTKVYLNDSELPIGQSFRESVAEILQNRATQLSPSK